MKRLARIVSMMCMVLSSNWVTQAQELVTPPAGLPEETWKIKYNDYRDLCDKEFLVPLIPDKERLVTIVRDNDQLYVKGMFEAYPDSWIHATVLWGKRIVFDVSTMVCASDSRMDKPGPVYAMNGIEHEVLIQYDRIYCKILFNENDNDSYDRVSCIYTFSEDGQSITSEVVFPNFDDVCSAFWCDTDITRHDLSYDEGCGSGLPDIDILCNLMFEKVSDDAIVDNDNASDAEWTEDDINHVKINAENTPPADLPEEIWNMQYNNYCMANWSGIDRERRERPVSIVRDGNMLYIKGIYADYPEFWMKATVEDNLVKFECGQLICEEDLILNAICPVYAMQGAEYYYASHNYTYGVRYCIKFYKHETNELYGRRCLLELSDDGKTISSEFDGYLYSEDECYTAFWYNTKPEEVKYERYFSNEFGLMGSGFPKVEFPVNVQFEYVSGGVVGVTYDANAAKAVIYDLYGRRVNPDNLRPGIYVRNGKKIMVK